jgi:hypothetical protein
MPGVKLIDESAGSRMRIVLHVWRPGLAIADVEVRVAVKPPTGPVVMVPVTPALVTLPAGPSAVTILDMDAKTVAPGLYIIEARVFHPTSGEMIARDMLAVVR